MKFNPLHCIDFYKADHRRQYPEGTTLVYSNLTPRSDKLATKSSVYDGKVVFFGLQYFIKSFLIDGFNESFFSRPKVEVIESYARRLGRSLGLKLSYEHILALHDLGYLPLEIKALPEGSCVPMGIPVLTIKNTHPDFFWLVNYLETALSCMLWKACTSATTARQYRMILDKYAEETADDCTTVDFQAHDFSFRGMSGIEDAALSGAAHLLFFKGTDTIPAIDLLEYAYRPIDALDFIGGSVPATEHSVMCMGQKESEIKTFERLITKIYPTGIVSIVSDTWDLWKVLDEYAPALKDKILAREGRVVFRPDSGNPEHIICGNPKSKNGAEILGCLELLWIHFGGTTNKKGYRELNPKVGLIYGDSITLERAESILKRMKEMEFASTNIVFGVGSFTYQYCTRDNFGFAMKATYGEVNGKGIDIYKNPVTDDGTKKSARGLLRVENRNGKYTLHECCTKELETHGELKPVFKDGVVFPTNSLRAIRHRVERGMK